MERLRPADVTLRDHPSRRDLVHLSIPRDPVLQERLKAEAPGCHYAPGVAHGAWAAPRELLREVSAICRGHGLWVADKTSPHRERRTRVTNLDERLYSFQQEGVQKILNEKSFALIYEMGMGKTPPAIQAMATVQPTRALIVAPAMVRLQWLDELRMWWPNHPEAYLVDSGKKAKAVLETGLPPITITSYQLAAYFKDLPFDFLIGDEFHYVMNHRATQSKTIARIWENNHRTAYKVALTGTPVMSRPHQIRHQLHCLYPWRYGGHWAFAERYCLMKDNPYARYLQPAGLDVEHAAELEYRLGLVSQRVTKAEHGHLLPAWQVTPIRVKANRQASKINKELAKTTDLEKFDEGAIGDLTSAKLATAYAWVADAIENQDHLIVLTHLRHTAHEVAGALRAAHDGAFVRSMTGDMSTKKRKETIEQVLWAPKGILVVTMHSVKEGLNSLVAFDQALMVELYWSPGVMAQVLGRFYRVNGACNVTILVVEGTVEEAISWVLQKRMREASKLVKKGSVEKQLSKAIYEAHNSKEDKEELLQILASRANPDEYGVCS